MPHPHLPPTPENSSNIKAQERHPTLDILFALPPSAMSARRAASPTDDNAIESTSISAASSASSYQPSPPVSPAQKAQSSNGRHRRTASGTPKAKAPSRSSSSTNDTSKADSSSPPLNLPPPPQRARKIIQMTPKMEAQDATPKNASPASSKKGAARKKQSGSATTAAGRRIARKTAHSIIERRRRSKMNEEFGVLKDMIPACKGQEMHKLAILQAGIEYLRWLEDTVDELKKDRSSGSSNRQSSKRAREEDEDFQDALTPAGYMSRPIERKTSITISEASPQLAPLSASSSVPSQLLNRQQSNASFEIISSPSTALPTPNLLPTSTLLSPAFGGLRFSPEMPRRSSHVNAAASRRASATASPNILPMPTAMMDLDNVSGLSRLEQVRGREREGGVRTPDQEATATAALMMLTRHDRRNSLSRYKIGSGRSGSGQEQEDDVELDEKGQKIRIKAMSVRDLLTT